MTVLIPGFIDKNFKLFMLAEPDYYHGVCLAGRKIILTVEIDRGQ